MDNGSRRIPERSLYIFSDKTRIVRQNVLECNALSDQPHNHLYWDARATNDWQASHYGWIDGNTI